MELELAGALVLVLVEVVKTTSIKTRGAADDAVDLVALVEEELCA